VVPPTSVRDCRTVRYRHPTTIRALSQRKLANKFSWLTQGCIHLHTYHACHSLLTAVRPRYRHGGRKRLRLSSYASSAGSVVVEGGFIASLLRSLRPMVWRCGIRYRFNLVALLRKGPLVPRFNRVTRRPHWSDGSGGCWLWLRPLVLLGPRGIVLCSLALQLDSSMAVRYSTYRDRDAAAPTAHYSSIRTLCSWPALLAGDRACCGVGNR
jgi:hypothetical protein